MEDIDNLPPVKFSQIQFSVSRDVENVSANQRPVWPSMLRDPPE